MEGGKWLRHPSFRGQTKNWQILGCALPPALVIVDAAVGRAAEAVDSVPVAFPINVLL